MMKILKQDPLLKNTVLYLILSVLVGFIILNLFHIKQIESIYEQHINITNGIVGELLEKYPQEELSIIDSINNINQKSISRGNEFFIKYGYNAKSIFNDENFKSYAIKSIGVFLSISILLILAYILIIKKLFNNILDLILNVSHYIDNFLNNDYKVVTYEEKEGLFMMVTSKLNHLGKKLELEINKLNVEKEDLKSLVTDISHQLKTPLSSIKLYNSILKEDDIKIEERHEFLDRNEKSIVKLHNLIDALVNISRLESGMIEIKPQNSSIKQTVIKAMNACYIKAMDKDISIDLNEFDDLHIPHDIKWTEEAIFNVLENAIKYTKEGGNIDINVSSTINYLRIDIKDNGIGINKDDINNIFKRFYRSNDKYVKKNEGSGVGLYLTRKILEQQGGSIIATKNINGGSTFSLLLQKCETN